MRWEVAKNQFGHFGATLTSIDAYTMAHDTLVRRQKVSNITSRNECGYHCETNDQGCLKSVKWDGGIKCWNGIVEWNSDLKIKYSYS